MTVDLSAARLGVDEAEAAKIVEQGGRTHNTPIWDAVIKDFTESGKRFERYDPNLFGLAVKDGEKVKPAAVASSITSHAKNRNLPVAAKSYGDGSVMLYSIQVEGEPTEPKPRGRKPKGQAAPEAE
jgi:hypothetical protein